MFQQTGNNQGPSAQPTGGFQSASAPAPPKEEKKKDSSKKKEEDKKKDKKEKEEEEKKRCKPVGTILYIFFFLLGCFLFLFGLLLLPFALLFKCMCICCAPFVDLAWWLIKAPVKLGKCISDACCC